MRQPIPAIRLWSVPLTEPSLTFLIEKTAYEIAYEADNRPSWIGVPLADLARLAGRIPKDIWLDLSCGRLIEICGLVKLLLTIRPSCGLHQPTRGAPMNQTLMLRIRERAYHIWAANGGEAEQNWLRAETEILSNSPAQPPKSVPPKKQPGTFRKANKMTSAKRAGRSEAPPTAEGLLP